MRYAERFYCNGKEVSDIKNSTGLMQDKHSSDLVINKKILKHYKAINAIDYIFS